MSSIYDKITSAKDLITEVMAHGLSTKTEDIVRAQDIFGNSGVGELEALATDTGRRDGDGAPSQFGSICTGSEGTQKCFYQIIFHIWGWERATEYYNKHSNPLYIEGREAVKNQKILETELSRKDETINANFKAKEEALRKLNEAIEKQNDLTAMLEDKEDEIVRLKAKLYDLMSK